MATAIRIEDLMFHGVVQFSSCVLWLYMRTKVVERRWKRRLKDESRGIESSTEAADSVRSDHLVILGTFALRRLQQ